MHFSWLKARKRKVRYAAALPTYGMGQIGGHNVGLEDIDIHADAHSLSAANGAHRGDGRLAVVKGFAPVKNTKICTLFSVSAFRFSLFFW